MKKKKSIHQRIKDNPAAFYFILAYLIVCLVWQWIFVMPYIRDKDYWEAFNMIFGFNPLTPFLGILIYYALKYILGFPYIIKDYLESKNQNKGN